MKGMGDMMQMVSMMQKGKGGMKKAMKQAGIAGIIADIVNAQRMDVKRMASAVDADVGINRMTEDRAAEIVADAIKGDLQEFARVFDELQEQRDTVLTAMLDDDEYDQYHSQRENSLPHIGEPEDGEEDG